MAAKSLLIAVLVAMVAVPSMATQYMVGDDAGWKVGVNYTEWAAGKKFYVGDAIEFLFEQGSDNVLRVDGPTFQKCVASNTTGLISGNVVIVFVKPGNKWYISTVDDHCSKGVKLAITVSEAPAPAPTPTPPQTPGSLGASKSSAFKPFGRMLKMILA